MNQITDPPLKYDAGLDFDYDVWGPNSHVRLARVPWDSGYKDVVKFANRAALNAYLQGLENTVAVTGVSYMRTGQPVRLDIPYSQARRFNYLVATNGVQPIPGDRGVSYYYFIKHARMVNPDTTEFTLQLDTWQSFIYDVEVKRGYLERGHLSMVRGQAANGSDWLAEPEPFDLGTDYAPRPIGNYFRNLFQNVDFIITSTNDLTALPGHDNDPRRNSAAGSYVSGIPLPVESYVVSYSDLQPYFQAMSLFPWVTAGVYRVVAVPKLDPSVYEPVPRKPHSYPGMQFAPYPPGPQGSNSSYLKKIVSQSVNVNVPNWTGIGAALAANFNQLNGAYGWMRKFQTAPFCYLYMIDGAGRELSLDPRLLREDYVNLQGRQSIVPGAEEVRVTVANYGRNTMDINDVGICINSFPTLPTLNDNASIALAGQAHGRSQAREAASWAQSRALAGNANSFDNASIGIDAASNAARVSRNQDILSTQSATGHMWDQALPGMISTVGGGAVGGAVGGPAGAAVGAGQGAASGMAGIWQTANNANQMNQQLNIRNNAAVEQAQISANAGRGVRDNNRTLADWAAKGDYSQAIAAIDAKVQDTQLTQPSLSGQVGGELSSWAMGRFNLVGVVKTIRESAIVRIGQYWSRYGYACNRFVNINNELTLMTRMTYWKLLDVAITTVPGLSEDYLNALRGIFEKGVTIYEDPELIVSDWNMSENRIK